MTGTPVEEAPKTEEERQEEIEEAIPSLDDALDAFVSTDKE